MDGWIDERTDGQTDRRVLNEMTNLRLTLTQTIFIFNQCIYKFADNPHQLNVGSAAGF